MIWAEDQASFRIECESEGLTDSRVREWLEYIRKEVRWAKKVFCSSLNLSRNELGDAGVAEIMKFLVAEGIPVLMIKLYKNWISDDGMRAIGDLIRHGPDPVVQEVHLSHNYISSEGAAAVFQAVLDSNRYPCSRGKEGSPLWLRLENNSIDWEPVLLRLKEWDLSWATGDTRDSWRKEGGAACPMVAMHRSYHHQGNVRPTTGPGSGSGFNGHGGSPASGNNREWQRHEDAWEQDQASESSGTAAGPVSGGDAPAGSSNRDGGRAAGPSGGNPRNLHRWASLEQEQYQHQANGSRRGDAADDDSGAGQDRHRGGGRGREHARAEDIADDGSCQEVQEVKRFVDSMLHDVAKVQQEKFSLIFSILHELQEKQLSLESSVQELLQQQRQHLLQPQQQPQVHQQYANVVQMVPVDGQQQTWAGDQHQFGRGVW